MDERFTIRRALDLGWEIADACGAAVLPAVPPPASPPRPGPGEAPLVLDHSLELRVARIRGGLEHVLGPTGTGRLDGLPVQAQLLAAHEAVLDALKSESTTLEHAYLLGGMLAAIGQEPWRAEPAARANKVRDALGGPRLEAARKLLEELRSVLPRHSAVVVVGSIARWAEWLAASASGVGWAGATGERAVGQLHEQADAWRSLLTSRSRGQDVLDADSQVAAARRLGLHVERLQLAHLRRFGSVWGLAGVLVLGALVVGAALTLGAIGASVVLVLGCLAAYRVVTAGLPAVTGSATEALWAAELRAAMVTAITVTPTPVEVATAPAPQPTAEEPARTALGQQ